jgi:hypothetical protein
MRPPFLAPGPPGRGPFPLLAPPELQPVPKAATIAKIIVRNQLKRWDAMFKFKRFILTVFSHFCINDKKVRN